LEYFTTFRDVYFMRLKSVEVFISYQLVKTNCN
jgi:hypothetical protein